MASILDLEEKIKRLFQQGGNFVNNAVKRTQQPSKVAFGNNPNNIGQNIRNYFDPTKSTNERPGFWSDRNPIAQFAAKPQNYRIPIANTFRATPKNNLNSQIGAGVQNLLLGIADETVNLPQRFLEGGNKFASIKRDNAFGDKGRLINATASVALPFVDTVTLGGGTLVKGIGKQAVKETAKVGLKQLAKKGILKGGTAGALYGGLYGASQGDTLDPQNVAQGAMGGLLLGGTLGGVSSTIGGLVGLIKKTPQAQKELVELASKQPRLPNGKYTYNQLKKPQGMTQPQWDFQLEFNKKYNRNPYTPVYYDDLHKAASYEAEKRGAGLSIRDVSKDPFLPKQYRKDSKNAYKVISGQKDNSTINAKDSDFRVPFSREVLENFKKKHPDKMTLTFNEALGFIKTLHFPNRINKLPEKQRNLYFRDLAGEFSEKINKVVLKPVTKDQKAYINSSYLVGGKKKIKKALEEPETSSSPIGGSSGFSTLNTNNIIPQRGNKVLVKPQMQINKEVGRLKDYTSPGSFTNTKADQVYQGPGPLPWETKLPDSQRQSLQGQKISGEQILPNQGPMLKVTGQKQQSVYPDMIGSSKKQSSKGIITPADEVSQNVAEGKTLLGNMGRGGFRGLDDDVKNSFQGWVNQRKATDIEGYLKKKDFMDLDSKGIEGIFEFQAGNKTGRFGDVKKFFDNKYKTLKDEGIDFNYKQDYLPQLWENSRDEVQAVFGRKLGLRPSFTIEAIFKDYQEGISKGLKPKFNNISDLAGWYEQRANKAIADKKFFTFLGENSFIAPSSKAPQSWQTLDPDRFPKFSVNVDGNQHTGAFKAPEELAKVINNYLRDPQFDLLTKVANYVSRVKNITLNFGIPRTAINAHGVNELARHTLMGTGGNPISRFITGAKYMIHPASAQKFLDKELTKAPNAIKNGLTLSAEDYTGFGKQAQNLAGQFSKKWEDIFGTPLFNKMLPAMKLDSYEHLVKQGMNGKDAAKLVNNVYGGINWEQMGRSRDFQNLLRAIILAPDWAETTVRLGGNFAKALNPLHKSETANRYRTMMATIMASYVAHNIVNKITSGHYSFENDLGHQFEIEAGYTADGEKRYFRPYGTGLDMVRLPFDVAMGLSRGDLTSVTRLFRNRLSIPAGVGVGLLTDQDYRGNAIGYRGTDKFGNEIPLGERATNIGSEMASLIGVPSFARQFLRTATGQQGIEEGLTQGFELPFRYSNTGNSNVQKQVENLTEGMSGKEKYEFNQNLKGQNKFSDSQIEFIQTGAKPNERLQQLIDKRAANKKEDEENKALKEGGTVTISGGKVKWLNTNGDIESVDLSKKSSSGQGIDAFNEDTSNASKARKIWGAPNDQVSKEEKEKAFKALGFTSEEVRYDYMSSDKFSSKERAGYIESKNMDHNTLLERLMTGRVESVSGNLFVSNSVLDELEDRGLITDAEAKALKKVKFDKNGKDISTASKGKSKTKLSLPKSSPSKLSISGGKIGSGRKPPAIKLSKAPVKVENTKVRNIKISTPERKISYKIVMPKNAKNSLDSSVKLV